MPQPNSPLIMKLTCEYTLTRNKISILHVLVKKIKINLNDFKMLRNFTHPFYVFFIDVSANNELKIQIIGRDFRYFVF